MSWQCIGLAVQKGVVICANLSPDLRQMNSPVISVPVHIKAPAGFAGAWFVRLETVDLKLDEFLSFSFG